MLPRLFFFLFLLAGPGLFAARAQSKFVVSTSTVRFFSATPVENIEATSTQLKGLLDADARVFAFRMPITSFTFPSGLMQAHFNENYMESGKFPYASFKGTLQGPFDLHKDGIYPVTAVGELTIHGVPQPRTIPCTLTVHNGAATVASKFQAKLVDHRIEVPQLVFSKIAEVIDITVAGALVPFASPVAAGR